MTTQSSSWKSAFQAFLDRRAFIMLCLGFSAGIPILLIFSSLSLWLGEAGIDKSAVTFFSWAALGYSFKFIWAPLIDELPVPYLTKKLGRRRAWLLIAQCLIITAICIMAFTNPALKQTLNPAFQILGLDFQFNIENWSLIQMAIGAVLLGFSAATQDIVIDAYRIELAGTEMQTILASTYNAGYRIGMIVAGAGALFLAASMGTAKGNYIYEAWQFTYLTMAAVMLLGIVTTLVIREPQVDRVYKSYQRSDYLRLVFVFFCAVLSFVIYYVNADTFIQKIITAWQIQDNILKFSFEAFRFLSAGAVAVLVASLLVKVGAVNKDMAYETWVNPIADFFRRYGLKLALVLLLLIGFYRISDIIAGVISNVFYQDLNFSKEQIAEAVKIYGVVFTLVGGFLGGLLAQRMNIMKLMFVGAILASCTNLIFIGLVKSGQDLDQVQLHVGAQTYTAQPDEVGYFKMQVPASELQRDQQIQISTQFVGDSASAFNTTLPYLKTSAQAQVMLLPITANAALYPAELKQSVVVKGQLSGVELSGIEDKKLALVLDGQHYPAKINEHGELTAAIDGKALAQAKQKQITLATDIAALQSSAAQQKLDYQVASQPRPSGLSVQMQAIAPIAAQDSGLVEIKGKVIKEYSSLWLYGAIILDNLASGFAGAAFIAFLSSLTSVSFTAVQYAIFSSLMTLTPKILGGYSGTIVTQIGYPKFFFMTTLIGIPILILVVWVAKLLKQHSNQT